MSLAQIAAKSAAELARLDYAASAVGDHVRFARYMGRAIHMEEDGGELWLRSTPVEGAPWIVTGVGLNEDPVAQTQRIAGPLWYGADVTQFAAPAQRESAQQILDGWAERTGRVVEVRADHVAVRVRRARGTRLVPFGRNNRDLVAWARFVTEIPDYADEWHELCAQVLQGLTRKLRERVLRADAAIRWGFCRNGRPAYRPSPRNGALELKLMQHIGFSVTTAHRQAVIAFLAYWQGFPYMREIGDGLNTLGEIEMWGWD